MKPYESIVEERGQAFLDAMLIIYTNFYYSELQIIDLCGRWIPRRTDLKEKSFLIRHASDEIRHAAMFRRGIEGLGLEFTDEMIEQYQVGDIGERFERLHSSDDELEVLVGLNLYAEGVLAMEELVELGEFATEYFPDFPKIAREEMVHLGFGRAVLERMFGENEKEKERAQIMCDEFAEHLVGYLRDDLGPIIDQGVEWKCVSPRYRENAIERFESVMTSVGLEVRWPGGSRSQAVAASSA